MRSKLGLQEVNAYNKDAINRAAFMPDETEEDNLFGFGGTVEASPRKHTGKLIEVNKGNKAGLNKQRENLFVSGGVANSWADYSKELAAKNPTNAVTHNTGLVGTGDLGTSDTGGLNILPMFTSSYLTANASSPTKPLDIIKTPSQTTVNIINGNSEQGSEEKGKSKIPKATVPLGFQLGDNEDRWESLARKQHKKTYVRVNDENGAPLTEPEHWAKVGEAFTDDYKNSKNWLGISKKDNPFSKGNIGNTMSTIGMAAASMGDQINTGDPRGLFDTLDPVYHLAGGRESAVGNALSDTGVALTKSGVPIAMLAGAALKIVGGLTNAAFGMKENKQMKKAADESIASNRNFRSNATSFDDIKGPASMTGTNIYEGGWFSGGAAADKNAQYARDMASAYSWADRSIGTNVRNISADQVEDFMRNYAALGGYFDRSKRKKRRLIKR